MTPRPEIRFATARGARIAYQEWGEGPPIVAIPPTAQNIDVAWEWPELAEMFEWFGEFSHYLHFDKRGTGSSDRSVLVPDVDSRVDDLRAVMDAAEIEHAHLFVQSEGGPTALLFAAAYPSRVDSVILLGSGARIGTQELSPEEMAGVEARRREFCERWGTLDSFALDIFAPSKRSDAEFCAWWPRYERMSAGADSLLDLFTQMDLLDARDVLPDLDVPLLVMHRRNDGAMPFRLAEEVVELARDARLVEISGDDHFAFVGDVREWMDEIERWVTGTVADRSRAAAQPSAGTVRVTTLGRFAVDVDGVEVETSAWGSRLARTLLKRLAVARGWPVTRDELFSLLWPDEADRSKLGARLSVQLSGVRRVLGGGVIADRQTVALDPGHVGLDLVAFFDAADDAAVIDAHAGPLLPEEQYEDWVAPFRDEVRARFTLAARRELDRAIGDDERMIDLARRLVDVDRWDEGAHRTLVETLDRVGDRAGADRARAVALEAFAEIGVAPDPPI